MIYCPYLLIVPFTKFYSTETARNEEITDLRAMTGRAIIRKRRAEAKVLGGGEVVVKPFYLLDVFSPPVPSTGELVTRRSYALMQC